jgi:hypothetical protein
MPFNKSSAPLYYKSVKEKENHICGGRHPYLAGPDDSKFPSRIRFIRRIHQYYGILGFPLAIVTDKTYNAYSGRSVDGIESPQRQPSLKIGAITGHRPPSECFRSEYWIPKFLLCAGTSSVESPPNALEESAFIGPVKGLAHCRSRLVTDVVAAALK